jgi:hypothetical protein
MVFPVIPAGNAAGTGEEPEARRHCIMFGTSIEGLPRGWHLVTINGKNLYGKFAKVALNVLKAVPQDTSEVPNLLTDELRALFGGALPSKPRVRLVRETSAAVWDIRVT